MPISLHNPAPVRNAANFLVAPICLSIVQVAELIGQSPETLKSDRKKFLRGARLNDDKRRLMSLAYKMGSQVRFPTHEVLQWVDELRIHCRRYGHDSATTEAGIRTVNPESSRPAVRKGISKRISVATATGKRPLPSETDKLVDSWAKTLTQAFPRPAWFTSITPGKPENATKKIFKSFVNLIRSDNDGRDPKWIEVCEPSGERKVFHIHALICGVDDIDLSHWRWRSHTKCELVKTDGAYWYVARKLAVGVGFDVSPGVTLSA